MGLSVWGGLKRKRRINAAGRSMEDISLSESEVENKRTSGRNWTVRMPRASSVAGVSPRSEVHIVFLPWLLLPLVHFYSCVFLSLLRSGPGTLLNAPSFSLSDSPDKRECPSFCLSFSTPLTASHSLFLSPSVSLSPTLIRYTDSSFQWTSFKRRLLPWVASSSSHPIFGHSFLIIKYFCNINSHECVLLGVQEGDEEAPLLLIWAQPRGRYSTVIARRSGRKEGLTRELFRPKSTSTTEYLHF